MANYPSYIQGKARAYQELLEDLKSGIFDL